MGVLGLVLAPAGFRQANRHFRQLPVLRRAPTHGSSEILRSLCRYSKSTFQRPSGKGIARERGLDAAELRTAGTFRNVPHSFRLPAAILSNSFLRVSAVSIRARSISEVDGRNRSPATFWRRISSMMGRISGARRRYPSTDMPTAGDISLITRIRLRGIGHCFNACAQYFT